MRCAIGARSYPTAVWARASGALARRESEPSARHFPRGAQVARETTGRRGRRPARLPLPAPRATKPRPVGQTAPAFTPPDASPGLDPVVPDLESRRRRPTDPASGRRPIRWTSRRPRRPEAAFAPPGRPNLNASMARRQKLPHPGAGPDRAARTDGRPDEKHHRIPGRSPMNSPTRFPEDPSPILRLPARDPRYG